MQHDHWISLTPQAGDRPRKLGARRLLPAALATGVLALSASAQLAENTPGVTFSIDYIGPTIAIPDSVYSVPITEADILAPFDPTLTRIPTYGPLPPPWIAISGGFGPPAAGLGLPLHPGCIGHPPGTVCRIEVDALSYGMDGVLEPVDYQRKGKVYFSVDRCSSGIPGTLLFPNVVCEGTGFGAREAQADAFMSLDLRLALFPPPIVVIGNTGAIDGNGLVSIPVCAPSGVSYPGLGLVEPFPFIGPPAPFDNLDALDTEGPIVDDSTVPTSGVYFSLDNGVVDPCTAAQGFPPSFSATANGPYRGGDVLFTPFPGGVAPFVYASAPSLGLDLLGPNTDDLDALAILENGIPGYQPSQDPYDWVGGDTDMVLFSVRRGSAIIGAPDSCSGRPIEEGDILTRPLAAGSPPCIVIPAEQLGLDTVRSGVAGQFPDDLDALDIRREEPVLITHGACYGTFGSCPCGNDDPTAGCVNSTGVGGLLLPSGSSSVIVDNLILTGTQLPPGNQGLFYMGDTIVNNPFFDGLQCALGNTFRFLGSIQNTGAVGTMVLGPGTAAASGGLIIPGTTWYFQAWHRDVNAPSPCGTGANLTNAMGVCFIP